MGECTSNNQIYTLLAGLWGEVVDVVDNSSILLKTQVVDVNFFASSRGVVSGELVTFPNPDMKLIPHYLENYSKKSEGKIIYAGEYIDKDIVKKASNLKIGALLVGSMLYEDYLYALSVGLEIGVITSFGNRRTPMQVYDYLNVVSNRFVFFQGETKRIRIPVETQFKALELKTPVFKLVRKGQAALIFQKPYFGEICVVDSVRDASIFVKVEKNDEPLEIHIPNIFLLS